MTASPETSQKLSMLLANIGRLTAVLAELQHVTEINPTGSNYLALGAVLDALESTAVTATCLCSGLAADLLEMQSSAASALKKH